MDLKQFLQDCILMVFLLNIHFGISSGIEDDYEDGPTTFNRCPWIRNKLKNGRVKYRYRGRVAKFVCDAGYELAGKRSATCVAGQWSNPLPVCVARGCNRMPTIANGRVTVMYRGALLGYDCNPGYALEGASSIHCDGRRWNTDPPTCSVATETPSVFCDFESPDLCGWSHDPTHDFDWKRNQFSTPSGHAATGPSFDHSFGENKGGYYLYIEASTPRKPNDTARIFSPVYSHFQSGGCFLFWYHMFGATTGALKVYLKPESHVLDELTPTWEKFGDQGNMWKRGNIDIPVLNEKFQIVIEGIRGESYVGDSAIDDVMLTTNDCLSMENDTGTTEKTIADSCRGRCREPDSDSTCGCNDNCNAAQNCCVDYITLCYEVPGNDTAGVNPEEPGDYYGKTTVLATVTATFTTESDAEAKSSSVSHDASLSSTTEKSVSTVYIPPPVSSISMSSTSPTTQAPIISSTESTTSPSSIPNPSTTSIPVFSSTSTVAVTEVSTTPKPIPISTTTVASTTKTTLSTSTTQATSTTPKPTTLSSTTTIKSTTTVTSTSLTTQTTSVSPTTSSTILTTSSTPAIIPSILTTTSPKSDKMSSAETITSTSSVLDTTSESPITSTYPDVTTLSSTRKTYNLRPRSSSTTSMSFSTESSTAKPTSTSTISIPSTTPTTETTFASSTPFSTSWHNLPVTKSSTLTSTMSTVKQITTIPTAKTTISSTTPRKVYTTISSKTTNRQAQKFTFIVTAPSVTLQDRENEHHTSKSQTSASKSNVPIVVSVIAIVLISVVGGVVYYIRRQKNKRQSKLSEDSEMRFLEENEHTEYSDPSVLDKILIK